MLKGCQSIYDADGGLLVVGEWDPRALFRTISPGDGYWHGRRVLDIGANTSGLSIEIARRGAFVTAAEPDPYGNTRGAVSGILAEVIRREALSVDLVDSDLLSVRALGEFDAVLCLGLIYHFRNPQYILDMLSTVCAGDLFVSTQTAKGSDLVLVNRCTPGCLPAGHVPPDVILSGWHPTRPLFERMLRWAGFGNVVALSDPKLNFPQKARGSYQQCLLQSNPRAHRRP